ncbi:hypothetical protein AKJ09_05707 [Labilithrix luteola]|uniref:Lipoprotein n=1 Tax=Labilithrix luteola TaxID=1391654 RepID=A0A0K1PZU0_9BACT|nr:hypothetical protein [Labilithrix luteola]AKU99043.1 hypothetical protein AKJ09_05707 [Labilithrix luteola]
MAAKNRSVRRSRRFAAAGLVALALPACGGKLDWAAAPSDAEDASPPGAAVGSDGGTLPEPEFPLGTFALCARGMLNEGEFMSRAFVEDGGVLTVTRSGNQLDVRYVNTYGEKSAFEFEATSNSLATIVRPQEPVLGYVSECVEDLGAIDLYPAELTISAGALTYDADTVFLTLGGTLTDTDTTPCGLRSAPAEHWLTCERSESAVPSSSPPARARANDSTSRFALGDYACTSQIETFLHDGGTTMYMGSGDDGTLTLSQSGAEIIATYGGDRFFGGTMNFALTTATSAQAESSGSPSLTCEVVPGDTKFPLSQGWSGTLTLVEDTLFLSFSGTMGANSQCSGTKKMGSVMCTKL